MGSEEEKPGYRLQATGSGEDFRVDEADPTEWKLVNSRFDNRYGYFCELPWPAAMLPGTYEWRPAEVMAYVHALGERQKAFEADVNAKLRELERVLGSTGSKLLSPQVSLGTGEPKT